MSTRLLDLKDRVITDSGSMVAKHDLLVSLALDGKSFTDLPFEEHPDARRYHHLRQTTKSARMWRETDTPVGPADNTYEWMTPEPYASMSIVELCEHALIDKDLDKEAYIERLAEELHLVEQKHMEDFIRCLLWITNVLRENRVVWGLGRGSSCASLILYLLDINKVDPVKYDIPLEEFYK